MCSSEPEFFSCFTKATQVALLDWEAWSQEVGGLVQPRVNVLWSCPGWRPIFQPTLLPTSNPGIERQPSGRLKLTLSSAASPGQQVLPWARGGDSLRTWGHLWSTAGIELKRKSKVSICQVKSRKIMNLCPFLKLSFKACDLTNKKKLFLVVASTPDYKSMCVRGQSKNLPTAKCQEWLICEVENVSHGAKKWKELGEYKIIRLEFDYRIIKLQCEYYYFIGF